MTLAPFTKTYHGVLALDFAGFELPDGQVCAVIGANGSGKSTLARIMAGTLEADGRAAALNRPASIGYMPQQSYAFQMSLLQNVLLNSNGDAGARVRAQALLERLEISRLSSRRAKQLSGGETARMALARLLMRDYQLLVLDEPTAAMDIRSTALSEELIDEYRSRTGCAVLWITHSLKQARRTAHTALFLHQGRLVESGPTETLFTEPRQPEWKRFLDFYGL